jgi:putative flippase GtrA
MRALKRFFKYALVGGSTFALDLLLLFLFTHVFGWHYLFATGIAFLTAVSINYLLSRRFVFKGTLRSVHAGYVGFLSIAALGLLWVTGLMFVCVEYLGWGYLPARVAVAAVVGIWNYLLNLYVNFKVVGMHRENQG